MDIVRDQGVASTFQSDLPIRAKLDRVRTELLDLSTRNRLINTPRRSKTARTIEVIDELSAEIYRLLVREGRNFTFLAGQAASGGAKISDEPEDSDDIAVLAQPEDDPLDERGIAQRHSDTRLQTRLTSQGLQRRLLDLFYDARTLMEEQGVSILYLALGFVKWKETPISDVERHAPLILVPVSLERGTAAEKFRIRWNQEDLVPNLSLEAFFDRGHGLKLPTFRLDDEFDLSAYMDEVATLIVDKSGWAVVPDDIVLGFFSFAKFMMYRDLDPDTWPTGAALSDRPLVTSLLSDGFNEDPLLPDDTPVDPLIGPADLVHIVDADSSQTLAIHEVRRGRNLVIQGPPGTGKSQTIANIIAATVADGKKVLFVAEKMAALEVVKRRLDQAGVGDSCLELHSNKANKRLVLEEIKRTWELGPPQGDSDRTLLQRLERCRDVLNGHVARLHHRHDASGLTPFHAISHLVRLRQAGQGPVSIHLTQPETWSRQNKDEREERLRDLCRRTAEMGLPIHHPWRGVALEFILPPDVERLTTRISDLRDRLAAHLEDRHVLAKALEIESPQSLSDLEPLLERARIIANAPDLELKALTADVWNDGLPAIRRLVESGLLLRRTRAEVRAAIRDSAWNTDLEPARINLARLPTNFGDVQLALIFRLDETLVRLLPERERLLSALGTTEADTLTGVARLLTIAHCVATAPDLEVEAFTAGVWDRRTEDIAELADAVRAVQEAKGVIGDIFNDASWGTDVVAARQVLAERGGSLFRWFSRSWRSADRLVSSLLAASDAVPPLSEIIGHLDRLSIVQRNLAIIGEQDSLGREAFGLLWRRDRSEVTALDTVITWMRSLRGVGTEVRHIAARTTDRPHIGELGRRVGALANEAAADLRSLLETMSRGGDSPFGQESAEADRIGLVLVASAVSGWHRSETQCREHLLMQGETLGCRVALLARLAEGQQVLAEIRNGDVLGREAFGRDWQGDASDWDVLTAAHDWLGRHGTLRRLAADLPERKDLKSQADAAEGDAFALSRDITALWGDLKFTPTTIFETIELARLPLSLVLQHLTLWSEHAEQLSKWIAYRDRAALADRAGLGDLVAQLKDGRLGGTGIISAFEFAYYEAMFLLMAKEMPELANFDGDAQSRLVQEFADLDRQRIELARLEVVIAHRRGIPSRGSGVGPLGILRTEMARRRGHMPIRQLLHKAGPAIQAIKPVFMMSPLSVAQFLAPGVIDFDLLVIDEASQIQPVDALGAIARCRQIVVVGDERQLPPTRFFSRMIAGNDEDEDEDGSAGVTDVESILGLCQARGLPQRMLRWHYRSRHQSLIAVSNSQFYDNRLYIVPSPYTVEAGMGLQFHHLPDGVYDSGNTSTNVVEAKAVAEEIIRHAKENPTLSLGVATFSTRQCRAILDELECLRRLTPETEPFFSGHPDEPFFVKSLENIQGDERDVIFISVGYGRNAQGYMAMRFGPLSAEGGERRLNVLISRAKRRCEVFASITDEDIDTERGKGKGVFAFKLFLHFARTGRLSFGQTTNREYDSVFEEQVAKALQSVGYDVHAQVGLVGFFIDLAITDTERPGRYVLGIECDGATYHSSRSARDRDRLRQAVLEADLPS